MLIGIKHRQLLDWLAAQWLAHGPAVCSVEGFPGVGKTTIAEALATRTQHSHRSIVVTFPETLNDPVAEFMWDLAGALDAPELTAVLGDRPAVSRALLRRLTEPVLIVVEEFQRALKKNGELVESAAQLLEWLGRAVGTPGRILFLTNRTVARTRWTERVAFRTLGRLTTDDGIILINRLLAEREQEAEVPAERRADVVEWVGGNPRAIRTVVESLRYLPLDELIGLAPEIWRTEDRTVAPELVRKLEERLLEQIVPRLDTVIQVALRNLAVHRKAFKKEAIEAISPNQSTAAETRSVLVDHFLLDHRAGNYSLTEVVREVVRCRLDDDPSALKAAHSQAADYYTRPFQAKQIVQSHQLGGWFIESYYHLVHAGREDELRRIAIRFSAELRSLYNGSSRIPIDAVERDERIAVLSAVLETQGDDGLHHYLARLLKARGSAPDLFRALNQARMAVGPQATAATWVLLIELARRVEGVDAAVESFQRGAKVVPPAQNLVSLYQSCGELLAREGRTGEAIELLREGIGRIPEQSLVSLYQSCGELLAREERTGEAIELLREGIGRIRPEHSLFSLYQSCGELLAREGRTGEAIELLREGIGRIPEHNLFSLYQSCGELLAREERTGDAIELLREGIGRIRPEHSLFSLYQSCGDLLAREGRTGEAIELLREGIGRIPEQSLVSLYQSCGELLAREERTGEAIELLREGISRIRPEHNLFSLYQSCGELLAREGRTGEAIELLHEGIGRIPEHNLFSLYQSCGELLAREGRTGEAIELLREGIGRIHPEHSLFSLYQSCGDLLAREGRTGEAIELLREGISRIRPEHSLFSLYQSCGELLAREGRTGDAMELLREGIGRIRPDQGLASLYRAKCVVLNLAARDHDALHVLLEGIRILPSGRFGRNLLEDAAIQLALRLREKGVLRTLREQSLSQHQRALTEVFELQLGEMWEAAALRAKAARDTAPHNLPLASHEAFCWLANSRPQNAAEALMRFPGEMRHAGAAHTWLTALICVLIGKMPEAGEAVESYLDRPLKPREEVDERMLLRLWDESAGAPGSNPSYIFPHLPPSLTGLREPVTRLPYGPSMLSKPRGERQETGIHFLVVATEWNPRHGGLSSFNKALCRALARAGHMVHCLVASAGEAEIADAAAARVTLVLAPAALGDNPETRLFRRPTLNRAPDVVIGHGRITGPAARVQAADYFPGSVRVHFLHTAPDHIEWFKAAPAEGEIAEKAEERTRIEVELSVTADLVVGVGPLLTDWITTRVRHGRRSEVSIHRLDPGLTSIRPGLNTPPPERACLVLGRAEDEVLKGIDIAASAIAGLPAKNRPRMVVRGAPQGQADSLQGRISSAYGGIPLDVRRYTSDVERVEEDVRQSSLVLMPSRSEGFGLVGLEAISAGVPVLVSGESGLGRLLSEIVPDLAHHFIVHVLNVPGEDTATWRKEIEFILRDRNAAFERARQLREALLPVLTWDRAVEQFREALAPLLSATSTSSS